jgi:undecaprenyl phosphate-alpha-L-ara4N flippase subunit ArnE
VTPLAGHAFLGLTILCTVAGQLAYKGYFRERNRLLIILSIFSFIAVPVLSYLALRVIALDEVYMATSLTIALTTLGSLYLFGERLVRWQWVGVILVMVGVFVYSL